MGYKKGVILLVMILALVITLRNVSFKLNLAAQINSCPLKSQGDSDCVADSAGKAITLTDFEIWRKEHFAVCSSTNLSACQTDVDNDGSLMDANFNYPGSGSAVTDMAVTIVDFEIWRKGNFASPASSSTPTPTGTSGPDPSFSCLDQAGPLQTVTGLHTSGKFEPPVAANKKFDARTASFEIPADISWGKVVLRGSADSINMCWAGGYVTASRTWHDLNISWDQSKHGQDGSGTFRNTAAVESFHGNITWTGLHVFNVHDGIRTSNSDNNWTIQHSWLDYIRDDCVEDDHIYSGTIYDSLFDGCYVGISTRPSSVYSSAGQTVKMDKVLLRMEPMPYPYKWDTKSDPTLTVTGYGSTPFGFGNVFKMEAGNEPNFEITNMVFLFEYNPKQILFPPKNKVTKCQNNTIIWFGSVSEAPTYLQNEFPGCFTIITDKIQGLALWKNLVTDWHSRHPGVGKDKKPANPGVYKWPRY